MLDLKIEVRGSVNDILTEERRAGARSVSRAMVGAAQTIKGAWRGEITGAGLGTRLANTVRAQAYPQSGFSITLLRWCGHGPRKSWVRSSAVRPSVHRTASGLPFHCLPP
jgi:hypothetical protein